MQRVLRADAPNRLWLTDITEHSTSEGKLYCCAITDVYSNRIVGYSISDRMTAKPAVDALRNAVVSRRGRRMHPARGQGQPIPQAGHGPRAAPSRHGRIDGQSPRRGGQRGLSATLENWSVPTFEK